MGKAWIEGYEDDYIEFEDLTIIDKNDFVPIVEIDVDQFKLKNSKWKYEGFKILSNGKSHTKLSDYHDKKHINQKLKVIEINSKEKEIYVRFIVKRGNKDSKDNRGYIKPISNGINILTTQKSIKMDYNEAVTLKLSTEKIAKNAYIDFFADDDDNKGTIDIFCGRIKVTKIKQGYPIIRITKQKVGKAKQRIIGWTYGTEYTTVDTYRAILTDSKNPSKIIKSFEVTRDAFAIKKSDSSEKKSILSNFAFEPKNGKINHYTGKFMPAYPYKPTKNDTPAIKLTQMNSEEMFAEANQDAVDLKYRIKKDVTRGIMIHVGGFYDNESMGITTGASEGCFGIINKGNSATNTSDSLVKEIMKKVKEMADNSTDTRVKKGHIRIIIEKRMKHEIPNKISYTRP